MLNSVRSAEGITPGGYGDKDAGELEITVIRLLLSHPVECD